MVNEWNEAIRFNWWAPSTRSISLETYPYLVLSLQDLSIRKNSIFRFLLNSLKRKQNPLEFKTTRLFFYFFVGGIIWMFNGIWKYIWKVKLNVKIISYFRKCFLNQKITLRSPRKYFELAPPKLGRSGDEKQTIFKSSLIFIKI